MVRIVRSSRAKADITGVLRYTKERWGEAKAREYRELIRDALNAIADDPTSGKLRVEARPGVLSYHIKQPAKNARHVIFYRVASDGVIELIRVLHDSMDFERHLR